MKTHHLTFVIARFVVSLVIVASMVQLVGCTPTDINPVATSTAPVHITDPSPKPIPKVFCPDCIDGDVPRIEPQPVTQK
jgi:hypothetical protein